VPNTAGEGGSWGMALLAAYAARTRRSQDLPAYLDEVIGDSIGTAIAPNPADVAGFNRYYQRYVAGLPIERAAVECMQEKHA